MYLDDLMLAAPSENQLLQDLSIALWLFTALGFIVNIPKSVTVLEFLGFVINTQTMTITLPQQKMHSIQKEAMHLLSLDTVQMKTLAHFIGTLVATRPASSTDGAFTLSCITRPQDNDTPPILILSDDGTDHQRCPGQPTVVGNSAARMQLFSNSEARGQGRDRVRCLKFRLGYSLSRGENGGEVDATGSTTTHQLLILELKAVS